MKQLVSRQAAIEAVQNRHIMLNKEKVLLINDLEKLPPAEPQIIRCNECKWNRTENRKETKQWLPCRAIVTPDNFSCIYAERRTEWE